MKDTDGYSNLNDYEDYYRAREEEINNKLLHNRVLDFEDIDYIENNYNFIDPLMGVFLVVDNYDNQYFFMMEDEHRDKPQQVILEHTVSMKWVKVK